MAFVEDCLGVAETALEGGIRYSSTSAAVISTNFRFLPSVLSEIELSHVAINGRAGLGQIAR
ncbi:hypothetical protein SAMN07250955_101447 [Arboricoccus pini]|uniref:Uncharacterized protein n=1 Tax=Arboricoccus pini TaxID=1963835 RepID=A0A212Q6G1_9PROT|nr:hypothetical protein SAMN07250955_101447 [Arboricoccus pini]